MSNNFPLTAPLAPFQYYRSYARRKDNGQRESWANTNERTVDALEDLGLDAKEADLLYTMQDQLKVFCSGRWLWVGGTEWVKDPANYLGSYNCSSTEIIDIHSFAMQMSMAAMGCGTGTVLEPRCIDQLPPVRNRLEVSIVEQIGVVPAGERCDTTALLFYTDSDRVAVSVGDSRQGWVDAYEAVLNLAVMAEAKLIGNSFQIEIHLDNVRPAGEPLKGFGGVANPAKLTALFPRMAEILNEAVGRKLNSLECCLLLDEAASVIVAGNIRRSASIRQGASTDAIFATAKDDLWQEKDGVWRIDPKRDALRMANHTRVFHHVPTQEEMVSSVSKQFYSGEGAIMFAPEAIARASADIMPNDWDRRWFIDQYVNGDGEAAIRELFFDQYGTAIPSEELQHRLHRYGLNPCFAPGTMILTRKGHFPIESLVGNIVEIWDGTQWVEIDNFRVTGEHQGVYTINLHSGQSITATAYHTFVLSDGSKRQLQDLKPGDNLLTNAIEIHGIHHEDSAYLKGFLVGDGTICNKNNPALRIYEPKDCCKGRLIASFHESKPSLVLANAGGKTGYHPIAEPGFRSSNWMQGLSVRKDELLPWVSTNRFDFPYEALNWDLPSKLDFIAGVMDADGNASDTKNGFLYQITSIHEQWLVGFQLLLKTIGVNSTLRKNRDARTVDFKHRGGLCECKATYRLTISQLSAIKLSQCVVFERLKSFASKKTVYKLKSKEGLIDSIEFSHTAEKVYCCTVPTNHQVTLSNGIITGQCAEVIGSDFLCNLSEVHLNQINPLDFEEQDTAFKAAAFAVLPLLHHKFMEPRQQQSRELDPIIGVSFTGLFDFFVHAFGVEWLRWWEAGRPSVYNIPSDYVKHVISFLGENPEDADIIVDAGALFLQAEETYLKRWKAIVQETTKDYCNRYGIREPNRCTLVQPAGSKSLLTGASSGWHPPKAQRFMRRMTFAKGDPVALAAVACGYSIVPSQSDKDENGNLLNDPHDERCTEWLVEVPVEVSWANLPGASEIEIEKFSALAQLDFYMQVQRHYSTHTTSATIELTQEEIEPLANAILDSIKRNRGYISVALLARFDAPFPRLPFEKIDQATCLKALAKVKERSNGLSFEENLAQLDDPNLGLQPQDAACEGLVCEMPKR